MTGNFHGQGSKGVAHGLHNLQYCSVVRGQVLIGALVAVVSAMTPAVLNASPRPPRVLFTCQFGMAKSAIARELLKRRAAERGILSRHHAGTALASSTRDVLLAEGIVLDAEEARKLSAVDLRAVDMVDFLHFYRIDA